MSEPVSVVSPRQAELEAQLERACGGLPRIDALNALSREICFTDPERAIMLAQQAHTLSSDTTLPEPYPIGIAASLFNQARSYLQIGKYAESMGCLLDAQPIYESIGDHEGLMWVNNEFGRLYYFLSDYPTALNYYLKELELARELGNRNRQAAVSHNIALVYSSTEDYTRAVETIRDGLEIAEQVGDVWVKAFLLSGLSEAYFHMNDYAHALEFGLAGVELARSRNLHSLISGALLALSWTYFEMGNLGQAGECLRSAFQTAKSAGDRRGVGEVLRAQAEQAVRQGQVQHALPLAQEALQISEELGEKALIANCCRAVSVAFTQLGDYHAALDAYQRYHQLDKEIFNEKSDLKLKSLAVIHQVERTRKESEIYRLHTVVLRQEIDERRKAQDALEYLANHDSLTGLLNWRAFFQLGQASVEFALLNGRYVSLIMLDIDKFKLVNDEYGHQMGDTILQNVAELLRQHVREVDLLVRYGGEEFAILLPDVEETSAAQIAERLRQKIAGQAHPTQDGSVAITISFGVAQSGLLSSISLNQLVTQADKALYAAKDAGRNRTVCYSQIADKDLTTAGAEKR